jgi:Flp pilus assembly protein protease CpaA
LVSLADFANGLGVGAGDVTYMTVATAATTITTAIITA